MLSFIQESRLSVAATLKQQVHLLHMNEMLTDAFLRSVPHTVKTVHMAWCSMVRRTEFFPRKRGKAYNKLRGKPLRIKIKGPETLSNP